MSDASKIPDPFRLWREWTEQAEQQLGSSLNAMKAAGELGNASRQMLDAFTAYQEAMRTASERFFSLSQPLVGAGATTSAARLDTLEERVSALESAMAASNDPFEQWREWFEAGEKEFQRRTQEMVSGEQLGAAASQVMELVSAYQRTMLETAEQLTTLGRRTGAPGTGDLEARLSAIEERLGAIESAVAGTPSGPPSGPDAED